MREQLEPSDEVVVVDASAGAATENAIREGHIAAAMVASFRYFRVAGSYRGLTRQRNFALDRVTRDLVAFFDDDTLLMPDCMGEMERVHRDLEKAVAGVGAFVEGAMTPDWRWRLRRLLRAIPDIPPGRYGRSGLSMPWTFLDRPGDRVDGDRLLGCAMMWRTEPASRVRFFEAFAGYAQGEDLDFSLRMRAEGRLIMASRARVRHLHEPAGRPDQFKMGYMAVRNLYLIHKRCIPDRTFLDVGWFVYAQLVDAAFVAANLALPRRWGSTMQQLGGRGRAVVDLVLGR
jgi:GT2 family glycosyltransferase